MKTWPKYLIAPPQWRSPALTDQEREDRIYAEDCPYEDCQVKAGEVCMTRKGNIRPHAHLDRVGAAIVTLLNEEALAAIT